jgi:hypothetical protein
MIPTVLAPDVSQWLFYGIFAVAGILVRHYWPNGPKVPSVPQPTTIPTIPALKDHPVFAHLFNAALAEARSDQATMESELLAGVQAAAQKLSGLPALPAPVKPAA